MKIKQAEFERLLILGHVKAIFFKKTLNGWSLLICSADHYLALVTAAGHERTWKSLDRLFADIESFASIHGLKIELVGSPK